MMKSFAVFVLLAATCAGADFRLGIVGTDTSHVPAFTKVFNDPSSPDHIPGYRVVAAYKGGSPKVESSITRVDKYAEQIRTTWNVEIVPDIATLCSKVDGVLLESVDGNVHLEQARQIIAAGKPMFIDKPLAASYEDAKEIARLAKAAGVPWFSTSSLRYSGYVTNMKFPDIQVATTWGPGPFEASHYLDLSWYAIHPVEMLFSILGPGCEEVTRVSSSGEKGVDQITCRWKDGRIGTILAQRPYGDYGSLVIRGDRKSQASGKQPTGYTPMLKEIVKFFQTKVPPVPNEETLEIFAFMDAAQKSKEAGGKPVKLRR